MILIVEKWSKMQKTERRRLYFVGVLRRVSGVKRREFLGNFCKHETATIFVAFPKGKVAMEIGHGIPSCKHLTIIVVMYL